MAYSQNQINYPGSIELTSNFAMKKLCRRGAFDRQLNCAYWREYNNKNVRSNDFFIELKSYLYLLAKRLLVPSWKWCIMSSTSTKMLYWIYHQWMNNVWKMKIFLSCDAYDLLFIESLFRQHLQHHFLSKLKFLLKQIILQHLMPVRYSFHFSDLMPGKIIKSRQIGPRPVKNFNIFIWFWYTWTLLWAWPTKVKSYKFITQTMCLPLDLFFWIWLGCGFLLTNNSNFRARPDHSLLISSLLIWKIKSELFVKGLASL